MYMKSHSNYGPGEQRNRENTWSQIGLDPATNSFGFGEKISANQAANAIHAERGPQDYPKTVIVQKVVEDARQVQADILGKAKNSG